mmetsp:Transcript_11507/g.29131  ORF Transcript_11507/g.29131 Transcript_11507/m.29131 type:complete len:250 (+) Transcript_11507:3288-4037(+)
MALKAFHHALSREQFQFAFLSLFDETLDLFLCRGNGAADHGHGVFIRNGITDSDGEATLQHPAVDEELNIRDKVTSRVRAVLLPGDVNHAVCCRTDCALVDDSRDELAPDDEDLRVAGGDVAVLIVRVGVCKADDVDVREDEGEELLSGPERAGLEDGRDGDLAVPLGDVEQDVHDKVLFEEGVALREEHGSDECVLHDAHDGAVALRRDDAARDEHELHDLRAGLVGLGDVKIHFVAVEIGVVRAGDG